MTAALTRQIEGLFAAGTAAGLSDRQLLERFAAARDEAAFAALVARHGPMVLGVCRQFLDDRHDAEDAFQAAFLVLARRAASIRDPDLIGNWLYGVALHAARNVRRRRARARRAEERLVMQRPEAESSRSAERSAIERERAEALYTEIGRLPAITRLPVVLCYLEGLSLAEAARRLRCPAGTVHSRLDRAKETLRRGLLRRGFAPSSAAVAAMLAPRSAQACVPPFLCDSTTRAAITFAARRVAGGAPSAATAMAQEVLSTMLIHKLKTAALAVLLIASLAAGAGHLIPSLGAFAASPEGEPSGEPRALTARTEPRTPDVPRPITGRMIVTGRVLRPDGSPAAGVPVDLIAAPRIPTAGTDVRRPPYVVLGQGVAGGDGRFRIEAARASSSRFYAVYALAGVAGRGTAFGCVELHPDAEAPSAEIRLQPEQVIRGKLVDISGQPVAGVAVRLASVSSASSRPGGGRFDGPQSVLFYDWPASPVGLRAWPGPVASDADGRFTFTGVGRGLEVTLALRDPRFAQQMIGLHTDDRGGPKDVSAALQPATIIEGRVLAADTGRPIPDAVFSVWSRPANAPGGRTMKFRADGQGRFRINPYAGEVFLTKIFPPDGQPYLTREVELTWTKGAVRKEVDFTLPRGQVIRGRVTEEGTGRPVAGASVRFFPVRPPQGLEGLVYGIDTSAATRDDGSFQVAVPAGEGRLLVVAPSLDYVTREIGGGPLYASGHRGGRRYYAHAIVAYETRAGEGPHPLDVTLQPGETLRGRAVGPAGETVDDAVILTRPQIHPANLCWNEYAFLHTHDGRFELTGFDPEKAAPAYVVDPEHQWGAAVELSGKQAGEDLTIRLQPCGQARVRFVGPEGKPVAGLRVWPYLQILMTPGSKRLGADDRGESPWADGAYLPNIDSRHHPTNLATDADGRATLLTLIPGALYRISDWSTVNVQGKGYQTRKDFTVKPGETIDLGDILVEKP